jgi:hypothetical protein
MVGSFYIYRLKGFKNIHDALQKNGGTVWGFMFNSTF